MLLVIDNYDSFTYNLVQILGQLLVESGHPDVSLRVVRNDAVDVEEVAELRPAAIVISPGPGRPEDAGVTMPVIRAFSGQVPILGVCLGHQAIAAAFGGRVVRAGRLMHGKASPILHNGQDLFEGLPSPFMAGRYHSLLVTEPLPEVLEVTARTPEGEIMALRHRAHPTFGVQFHPESVLTPEGLRLLRNFLAIGGYP
ncbi:aminodeoxychorismate/anthranilate synthase component II [Thermoflexus sp.]|uniref:anthranilate synthase component II n=1 Tax=Thermoflexus sp. TaxID=1969742 RepID=UPI0025EC6D77|nr:aminodeoxychorismate/anthranilate synthase component II [Thermoflexus sp.]MDW8181586.1 aminodeoxychorismate/anthranilate synthase component II [Anaerolineae bacterium]MCS6962585.1 aminodeoxychorismate/anthranilate synthase component II [Thermoflexus sp.]MCS7352127.1 aminodeoxychorismate/anthranilate synthase component II [Thermoflexus sp.]MCX7691593.1 aminodeoxychorismate/anthranilate synthase component II [Thermoflexus sp.]MDW8185626.1 aminodeoxychorismate/anthranilate synthase component I